jgi:hypothetical protein
MISVAVINMSKTSKNYEVPWAIKSRVLNGRVGEIFGLSGLQVSEPDNPTDSQMILTTSRTREEAMMFDWINLATIIERIAFCSYLFILLCFALGACF